MTIELNRRTFTALLGASCAAVAIARPVRKTAAFRASPTATQRCFMNHQLFCIPARPKTSAINYLSE